MRTSAPALAPIFRSDMQGRVLALLFEHPERRPSISDVARTVGAPIASVHREISRLEASGVVRTTAVGRSRLVQPDPESPISAELGALVRKVYGPPAVIAELLGGVEGVERTFIFGSWAERFLGTPGPPPVDIDVLVLGDPDRDETFAVAEEAGRRLGTEVQIVVRRPDAWEAPDGFIVGVRAGPLVPLPLGWDVSEAGVTGRGLLDL